MEYQSFGKSGVKTSRLCFGAMLLSSNGMGPWGMPAVVDEVTASAMLDRYVSVGGNLIDTSNNYGQSEAIIGNWLKRQNTHARRKLIICTKFSSPVNNIPAKAAINYPNSSGSSRKHIMDAVEDSLEKLQTKYIDVYTVHFWNDATQLEDVIRTLQSLIEMGRIRYYAVSNYTPTQLQQLISLCQRHQWELPIFIQSQYSLLCRTTEWELIRLCQSNGIGFLAWSPLAGGWLSNKYASVDNKQFTEPPINSRMSFAESVHFSSWDFSNMATDPKTWLVLRTCAEVASELKTTVSQVAIRWVLDQSITGCILGPRSLAHLEDNIAALKIKLTSKHMLMLNDASRSPPIYPYCKFSDLTVKSSPVLPIIAGNTASPKTPSLPDSAALHQLVQFSCSFQPTPNRSPWMARSINQRIYELGASINPHYKMNSLRDDTSRHSVFQSQPMKIAFVFGDFLNIEEHIMTLRHILSHLHLSIGLRSLIHDGLELIDQLKLYVVKELNTTWIDDNLSLIEWIQLGVVDSTTYNQPSYPAILPISIMNQLVLLMYFLECTNLTLPQLKRFCIFSSGFNIGAVAAYVVDISNNDKQLRHNTFAAMRLCFWFGLRTNEDFQKQKLEQYQQQLGTLETNLSSSSKIDESLKINHLSDSLQMSHVPYQDVSDAINEFNSTNQLGHHFDVCAVPKYDHVILTGASYDTSRLVEYLQLKFPSCSLTSVALDKRIHSERYYPHTMSKILNDFFSQQPYFEGNPSKNHWEQTVLISDSDGQPSLKLTCDELISNLLHKVCRWDLVSDYFAHTIQANVSVTPDSIAILDFSLDKNSINLISNHPHLISYLAKGQITLFTMTDLAHNFLTAVEKIHENTMSNSSWIKHSISNYQDPVKNNIAIVGMACRFPDANNPDEFYYNLLHKKHSIRSIPQERWNHSVYYDPNPKNIFKTSAQHLGVMEDIDMFDPQFFNINMRDATRMDPQHRLTLETCYLALENAGYVIGEGIRSGFNEHRVGVFVGCTAADTYRKNMEAYMDAYLVQCEARSMQAGRVSYFFKFCGPSIQIDTACATGLVCLHMAVQSILSGECDTAVISSVLVSTDPLEYLVLSAGGFFSTGSTGGCKAFASDADGYTRSDGVAAIVIKPYNAALRDKDCIHALVNSTAINQSGQAQNLLLPSESQIESLIRTTLHKAHIPPSAIQYTEAHGTGTQRGDPIEMNAIIKALGMNVDRSKENPLYVGSHKAFIGHSEAASGLAGLIKTVMMMQHKTITSHIPIKELNPDIKIQEHVIIPQEARAWTVPYTHVPRRAVINSFGFSGANASCVIQEPPTAFDKNNKELIEPLHLITISGKHPDSVRAYVIPFLQYLVAFQSKLTDESDSTIATCKTAELRFLRDLAFTTTVRRNHFPHRIAIVASTVKDLIRKLTTVLASIPDQLNRLKKTLGPEYANLLTTSNQGVFLSKDLENSTTKLATVSSVPLPIRVVFVIGGQGSQYFGMCRQLLECSNVWAVTFRRCSEIFATLHPTVLPKKMTLLELLQAAHQHESLSNTDHGKSLLEEEDFISTQVCQPLLFAIEYSLGKMLMSWGVYPNFIIGHSMGELVGACLSSVMTLEDALFLIGHRAILLEKTAKGAMLAINCTIDDFQHLCRTLRFNENGEMEACLAAHNGPRSILVAGEPKTIDRLQAKIVGDKLFLSKKLNINHAFHTHFMTSILAEFHSVAKKIAYKKANIPLIDTVTGELRTTFNADYWTVQLRQTVQFNLAVSSLYRLSCTEKFQPVCIELSPTPILLQYLTEANEDIQSYCVLHKNRSDLEQIYSVLGGLYARQSSTLCWSELHRANHHARVLSLPNYVFNHKSCWLKLPWVSERVLEENAWISSVDVKPTVNFRNLSIGGSTESAEELPLIGKCHILKDKSSGRFECLFSVFDRSWRSDIQNHIVASKPLFSIPLYTALTSQFALYVIQASGTRFDSKMYANIRDLTIKSPFIWEDTDSNQESCRQMSIVLIPVSQKNVEDNNHQMFTFSVTSRRRTGKKKAENGKSVEHSCGTVSLSISGLDDTTVNNASFNRIQSAVVDNTGNSPIFLCYDGPEFYKLSSEFGTTYGSHYQSVKKMVISNDGLTSWSKQIIHPNQPYSDPNHCTLIHPSWLDSFLQAVTVQVAQIPELNRPFVGLFVENLICCTHVYRADHRAHNGHSESKVDETHAKSPTFYAENQFRINNPNLITGETRGFDENGKCVLHVVGAIMMSAMTGFTSRPENESDALLTQNSESINNKMTTFSTSNKQHVLEIPDSKYRATIENMTVRVISSSLQVEPSSLDPTENFADMGIDSILSIELRAGLNRAFPDIILPPSTLFDHPSIAALVTFIVSLEPTIINHNDGDHEEMEEKDAFS